MRFELPTITDHGSIVENTFTNCSSSSAPTGETLGNGGIPGKNRENLIQDKFGECSHS